MTQKIIKLKTQVLIIGGGATGTGILRDLSLRGIQCLLVEKGDLNAGASGANHGLLHSGGRYVANDKEAAVECRQEGRILKRVAPHLIELTGGLFVAVKGDDEAFIADFPGRCARCGISSNPVEPKDARDMEPALSGDLIAAYSVEDASIDPFGLVLDNAADAMANGGSLLLNTPVTALEVTRGGISAALLRNRFTGRCYRVEADLVVNASGAWAREIASLAGVPIDVQYSKGSLVITNTRLTRRVMNRLRPASDADIMVPGGTVSVIGTTSIHIDSLDDIHPEVSEADYIIANAREMIPALETTRYIRAYAGVRPLAGSGAKEDDRNVSRGFALMDHEQCGIDNFITITGGKLTTFRLMAERTSDLVCRKLAVDRPCLTADIPLPPSDAGRWTRPAQAPLEWMQAGRHNDPMLCECEMVSRHTVSSLKKHIDMQHGKTGLKAIGLRSRVGKGTCQGAFCSVRIVGQLYDDGLFTGTEGIYDLIRFLGSRWKGMRPVLWDATLAQEELQESLHCGLFSLEMPEWKEDRAS